MSSPFATDSLLLPLNKLDKNGVSLLRTEDERDRHYTAIQQHIPKVVAAFVRSGCRSQADFWSACARQFATRACVRDVGSGRSFTYLEMNEHASQVAHWAKTVGWKKGDTIALMIENSAELIWTWLGLQKLGLVVAMVNTNHKGRALAHSLNVSFARAAVVGVKFARAWEDARAYMKSADAALDVWWVVGCHSRSLLPKSCSPSRIVDTVLVHQPVSEPPVEWRAGILPTDTCSLIFTSGTTGKSKAVRCVQSSFTFSGVVFKTHMRLTKDDVFYLTLPLYHSSGLIVTLPMVFLAGATLVVREKFSPRAFWSDVRRFRCTAMIYIGELWNYLTTQPVCDGEKGQTLRKAIGNGLRASVWREVQQRFRIPHIVEFYGQTEMPLKRMKGMSMINSFGMPGACSYFPAKLRKDEIVLVEYDVETGNPKRFPDQSGGPSLCRRVQRGARGLYLRELLPSHDGDTYTTRADSKKPLLGMYSKREIYSSRMAIYCALMPMGGLTLWIELEILFDGRARMSPQMKFATLFRPSKRFPRPMSTA
eukprot:256403_1